MTTIDDVVEKFAISEAVHRYFHALDVFDWTTLAPLVADEIELNHGMPGVPNSTMSRDDFIEDVKARNGGFAQTLHANPDHVIDLDGDTAKVTAHMYAAHIIAPGDDGWFGGWGRYELGLAKQDGNWKLSYLGIVPVQVYGDPGALYGAAAERQKSGDGHY